MTTSPQLPNKEDSWDWDFTDIEREVGDVLLQPDSHQRKAKTTYLYRLMINAFGKRLDFVEAKHRRELQTQREELERELMGKVKMVCLGKITSLGFMFNWTSLERTRVNQELNNALESLLTKRGEGQ